MIISYTKEISDTIENLVLEQSLIPLFYTSNVAKKKSKIFNPAFGDTFYDPSRDIFKPYSHMFLEVVYRLGNALNMVIEGIMQGRIFVHLPSPNPGLEPYSHMFLEVVYRLDDMVIEGIIE
jgi:hypothetical protein